MFSSLPLPTFAVRPSALSLNFPLFNFSTYKINSLRTISIFFFPASLTNPTVLFCLIVATSLSIAPPIAICRAPCPPSRPKNAPSSGFLNPFTYCQLKAYNEPNLVYLSHPEASCLRVQLTGSLLNAFWQNPREVSRNHTQ